MESLFSFDFLASLLPFLLLIVVFIFFMKKMGGNMSYSDYLEKHNEAVENQNIVIKDQTKELKRIADIIEKHYDRKC